MTTAFLSVGIKTDSAKTALKELRQELAQGVKVAVAIDPTSIDQSIQGYLRQRTFKVAVNGRKLRDEVADAIEFGITDAFKKQRTLIWNQAAFRGGLNSAFEAVFNARRKVAVDHDGLAHSIESTVALALGKPHRVGIDAAALAADIHAALGGGLVAAPPALGAVQAGAGIDQQALLRTIGTRVEAALVGPLDKLGQAAQQVAAVAAQVVRVGRATDASGTSSKRVKTGASFTDEQTGLRTSFSQNLSGADAVAAERRARESAREVQLQQDFQESIRYAKRVSDFEQALQRQREEEATLRGRSAGRVDTRTLLGLPSDTEMRRETSLIKAQMLANAASIREAMEQVVKAAQFQRGDQYNRKGRQILSAAALTEDGRFTPDQVKSFVKNDSVVAAIDQLETYRKTTKQAADEGEKAHKRVSAAALASAGSTRDLTKATYDAHSAARGLAGSLGAIWLTWGSTLPIAGAAGIGATLRSAFVAGKELEYQLTFVKVLSDGATVSFKQLADTAVGAMVRPTEAAAGLRGLAQNGLSAAEALKALPDILNLATAGEMGLQEAALGATGVMAAFGLHVDDLGRISDVFAKAASESNTSVQAMVESMKQASTVADQYGVTLEETAAALAVMAKRNIVSTAAGTAFRNMMNELAAPTDHAKQALHLLGVEAYDAASGKLKPASVILRELKDSVVLLNEKSRINLLSNVFGERGAKAANAVLSDFTEFERQLDIATNKSKGFAASVNEALGETTQGQVKKLMAEFEVQTTQAFAGAKGSVDSLITSIRAFVNSPEFVQGVGALVSNVAALTETVVEHKGAIALLLEVYAAYRISAALMASSVGRATAAFIASGLESRALAAAHGAQAVAAQAAAVAETELAVASRSAAAASALATGGLSILLGVVAVAASEYLLFSDHADKAALAQAALQREINQSLDTLQKSIDKQRAENQELSLRNQLMREGLGYEEAGKKAHDQIAATQASKDALSYDQQRATLLQKINDLEQSRRSLNASGVKNASVIVAGPLADARRELDALDKLHAAQLEQQRRRDEEAALKTKNDEEKAFGDRLRQAREFNARLEEIEKKSGGKTKVADLRLPTDDTSLRSGDFKRQFDEVNEALNARLQNKVVKSRQEQSEEDRLANARMQRVAQEAKQTEEALKQEAKAYRDLELARFDPSRFGQGIAALIAEQTEREYTAQLIKIEADAIKALEAEKVGKKGSEKERIDAEISARKHSIDMLKAELATRSQIEALKVHTEEIKQQDADQAVLNSLASKSGVEIDKLERKREFKVVSKVDSARDAAEASARAEYESHILSIKERIKATDEAIDELIVEQLLSTSDQQDDAQALVDAAQQRRDYEQGVMEALEAQRDASAAMRGNKAANDALWSQSAEAGWKRFWKDYQEGAASAAENVYDIMRTTTDGMSNLVAQFVTTGKLKWREFGASVAAEAAKMMANRAILQLLNMFVSWAGSSGSPGATGGTPGSGGDGIAGYADGGISSGPQLAMVSEGRYNREAHVPLPDGRSIPVTIREPAVAAAGGGTNVYVNVNIASDGSSKTDVESSRREGKALGEKMALVARQVIAEERRSGGLLEKAA